MDRPLAEYVGLYWRLVAARGRAQLQYKVSFVLLVIGSSLNLLVDLGEILVFFRFIRSFVGWTLPEVAVLYGFSASSFSIAEALAMGFDQFYRSILQGTFDRTLVRPLGAFFQVFASDLGVRRVGRVGQGLIVLAVATASLGIVWTPDKVGVFVLTLASGTAIFFSFFVIGAASTFWTVQANEVVNIFTHGGTFISSYPADILTYWLRRFVTFVVPLAFINYYPTLYILGRDDPLGLPGWARLLSPVAAAVMLLVARTAWSVGVRRYQSTGS